MPQPELDSWWCRTKRERTNLKIVRARNRATECRIGTICFHCNAFLHNWMQTMTRWSIFFAVPLISLGKSMDLQMILHQANMINYTPMSVSLSKVLYLLLNTYYYLTTTSTTDLEKPLSSIFSILYLRLFLTNYYDFYRFLKIFSQFPTQLLYLISIICHTRCF